ncbi:hypothetical protein [Fructilactobacillus florum]|uniref:Uncharacterized protein n=1 Tax=Fructilactobacillus florum DSM 22689 = JCM 16035 TaxID=1423745 RepID=A0A0R2CU15_9LACO|nr:hypothetical protein [Fructilactobacillus florum]KRM91657.1 hypothetical protein FC87_GL000794 [Fructilactobacillus florum DSM 22689 = JCM 16035]
MKNEPSQLNQTRSATNDAQMSGAETETRTSRYGKQPGQRVSAGQSEQEPLPKRDLALQRQNRLGRRLNWAIFILVVLIILVLLIMRFVG